MGKLSSRDKELMGAERNVMPTEPHPGPRSVSRTSKPANPK